MPALSPSHRLDALCRAHQLDFRPAEADQPAYLFYHRTPPSSVLREVRLLAGAFELSRVAEPALDLPLRVPDRVDVAPEADPFLTTGSAQQLADAWIRQAIAQGASDLHIEPFEHTLRVRFRLDGVLREAGQINGIQASAVASRLKVMADLDIAERRRPQDGRIRFNDAGTAIDLRVSTLP
ncbi:MAG: ATPase, T2SS/T4P/T4SS family, partial [Bacteroidota bacterium]